ncbi:ankyrin repeat domain-containing protein [Legionella nautarum]|nr:ankyrin repeat domain-containing protein [Legionella nautarum]
MIRYALKNHLKRMQEYLRKKGKIALEEREKETNGSAFHLAAYQGHLDILKYLVRFAGKQHLLEVNKEGSSVLDIALDSRRPSARVVIYLLFDIKVPFSQKTLALLKKKKGTFVQEIEKTFSEPEKTFYLQQMNKLLDLAGQPDWRESRRANFAKPPSLFQLAARSSFFLKDLKGKMQILPVDVQEKMTDQILLECEEDLLGKLILK